MTDYRELLIGCGNQRAKRVFPQGRPREWRNLTTLDIDPHAKPDIEHDLERLPLPFVDNSFDEIHALHTLEHVGRQGDFRFYFAQFADFWRILKPGGFFCAVVPPLNSRWLLGDPGHTRVIQPETLVFLNQEEYTKQVGVTAMTDYRHWYRADLVTRFCSPFNADELAFVLEAIKPSRISI